MANPEGVVGEGVLVSGVGLLGLVLSSLRFRRNGVVEEREKFRAAVGTGRRNTANGGSVIFLAHGPKQDVKPLLEVVVAINSCWDRLEGDGAALASNLRRGSGTQNFQTCLFRNGSRPAPVLVI